MDEFISGETTVAKALKDGCAARIAERVNLPVSTVKHRLSRASQNARLRTVFGDEWDKDLLGIIGARTAARARDDKFIALVAWILDLNPYTVQTRISGAIGNTHLSRVFASEWPDDSKRAQANQRAREYLSNQLLDWIDAQDLAPALEVMMNLGKKAVRGILSSYSSQTKVADLLAPPAAPNSQSQVARSCGPEQTPMPPVPMSEPDGFDELQTAFAGGNLIAFCGAGISMAAGLPSWKGLLDIVIRRARSYSLSHDMIDDIEQLAVENRYIDAFSAAASALGMAEFASVVEPALDDRHPDRFLPVPDVASSIAALAPRLRAVLTTNLDHILERAFSGNWPALSKANGSLASRRNFILKLHGTLWDRETWVLTREQYARAMYMDPHLQATFSGLFHTCPLLFVGCGLSDEDLDQVLMRIRAVGTSHTPRHFALVARSSVRRFRERQLADAGVRLIPYDNGDGRHAEVARLLRCLSVG